MDAASAVGKRKIKATVWWTLVVFLMGAALLSGSLSAQESPAVSLSASHPAVSSSLSVPTVSSPESVPTVSSSESVPTVSSSAGVPTVSSSASLPAVSLPASFRLVAENEFLMLFINEDTTEIAVAQKRTGLVWYSSPKDRQTRERVARGAARDRLNAQLSITYYTPEDQRRFMDTYTDAILHDQYSITPLPSGVRVDYTLGAQWREDDYLPVFVTEDKLHALLESIADRFDRDFVRSLYGLVTMAEEESPSPLQIVGIDAQSLFGNARLSSTEIRGDTVYQTFLNHLVEYRLDLSARNQLKPEDIQRFVGQSFYMLKRFRSALPAWDREDAIALIKESDAFSIEDVIEDHTRFGIDPPKPNVRVFELAIEYILDGDSLVVRVPVSDVKYPIDVIDETGTRVSYPLEIITVQEFFGAADGSNDGYIFVPDGSGALIHLNNGKLSAPAFDVPVYGLDLASQLRLDRTQFINQLHLPVFGLKDGDQAFLAVIEDGDALARIRADIGGRTSSFNTVHAAFTILPRGTVSLSGDLRDQSINIYQTRKYEGDIQIRYLFLDGEKANYAGMAQAYQDYLAQKHGWQRRKKRDEIPLLLEVIGAIHVRKPVLGIPRDVVQPLTTYDEVRELVTDLRGRGISAMAVRYTGWFGRGVEHEFPTRISLRREMGGKAGFEQLRTFLSAQDIDFYPDVALFQVYEGGLMQGFWTRRDATRMLDRRIARVFDYNLATYRFERDRSRFLLSPGRLSHLVDRLEQELRPLDLSGLALRHVGTQLYSDFRDQPTLLVDRQQALDIVVSQVERFRNELGLNLAVDGGNAYVLPHVTAVFNMPLTGSKYNFIDEEIPFMAMVLHGYVDFAGEPINLAQDFRQNILKSIESGALPYFKLAYADGSAVVQTEFDSLFSLSYHQWADDVVAVYEWAKQLLTPIDGERIVGHETVAPGVVKTVYENGKAIVVDYNRGEAWLE